MKFEGFLISDYNAIDALPGDYRADIKQSINAGMDMVMVPQKYREFYTTLKDLAQKGEVPMSRIDDAVLRILRVKMRDGPVRPRAARSWPTARCRPRSARPRTATSRAAPFASRWCC